MKSHWWLEKKNNKKKIGVKHQEEEYTRQSKP